MLSPGPWVSVRTGARASAPAPRPLLCPRESLQVSGPDTLCGIDRRRRDSDREAVGKGMVRCQPGVARCCRLGKALGVCTASGREASVLS